MYPIPISVIVPCFNEERTIYKNVKKIAEFLESNFSSFELVVVNDGSTDRTLKELEKATSEVPLRIISNAKNQGKGSAVKDGFLGCRDDSEIVMFMDADLAIPIEELPAFVEGIHRGFDIVIASRFVPGAKKLEPVPWYRIIMEKVFRLMRMIILNNWSVKDTQCGFKVFSHKAARNIFPSLKVRRFAFDAEIIFLAKKWGYKVKELPISLQNPRYSHIRIFLDPLNMSLDLIRVRLNYLLGKYRKPIDNDN